MDFNKIVDNLKELNEANLKTLDNLYKFNQILNMIEVSINEKLNKTNNDTINILNLIESNEKLFNSICDDLINF